MSSLTRAQFLLMQLVQHTNINSNTNTNNKTKTKNYYFYTYRIIKRYLILSKKIIKIVTKSNFYMIRDSLKPVTVVWVLLIVERLFHSVAPR